MVFVLPRENKTYFGTTDTDYTGDLEHPKVTHEDVDYLLGIVNNPSRKQNITIDDIESSKAGLRPLVAGTLLLTTTAETTVLSVMKASMN